MRENESDGEGGWVQPHDYASPWAPRGEGRDEGEAGETRWPRANAAPTPGNGYPDTIVFGPPPGFSGGAFLFRACSLAESTVHA